MADIGGYVYVVGLSNSLNRWFFTRKGDALGAIFRSSYPTTKLRMFRVPAYTRSLEVIPKCVEYDVEEELRLNGYTKQETK